MKRCSVFCKKQTRRRNGVGFALHSIWWTVRAVSYTHLVEGRDEAAIAASAERIAVKINERIH